MCALFLPLSSIKTVDALLMVEAHVFLIMCVGVECILGARWLIWSSLYEWICVTKGFSLLSVEGISVSGSSTRVYFGFGAVFGIDHQWLIINGDIAMLVTSFISTLITCQCCYPDFLSISRQHRSIGGTTLEGIIWFWNEPY